MKHPVFIGGGKVRLAGAEAAEKGWWKDSESGAAFDDDDDE